MRKQIASNSSGSGNYSPIGLSSMPMSYHTGNAAVVTPSGAASSSPNTYVLPSQSLPEPTYATSPQSKFP